MTHEIYNWIGFGLPLMEVVSIESELSLRFELWGVRKNHSKIFILRIYICRILWHPLWWENLKPFVWNCSILLRFVWCCAFNILFIEDRLSSSWDILNLKWSFELVSHEMMWTNWTQMLIFGLSASRVMRLKFSDQDWIRTSWDMLYLSKFLLKYHLGKNIATYL